MPGMTIIEQQLQGTPPGLGRSLDNRACLFNKTSLVAMDLEQYFCLLRILNQQPLNTNPAKNAFKKGPNVCEITSNITLSISGNHQKVGGPTE